MTSPLYQRIYDLVCQVPAGHVTTYGQLARLVGCTARTVGFAMAALPTDYAVPWQRVINSKGKVSPRSDGDHDFLQRDLLVSEGVKFDRTGRLDLERYAWAFSVLDIPE